MPMQVEHEASFLERTSHFAEAEEMISSQPEVSLGYTAEALVAFLHLQTLCRCLED